jgi:hypothetical protein
MRYALGQVIHNPVDKAPTPFLALFDRSHNGVVYGPVVPGGMLIFRRIAAADIPAGQADAQVDPAVPALNALFTNMVGWFQIFRCLDVLTIVHKSSMLTFPRHRGRKIFIRPSATAAHPCL